LRVDIDLRPDQKIAGVRLVRQGRRRLRWLRTPHWSELGDRTKPLVQPKLLNGLPK